MKINKKELKKWIAAIRSGNFKQTRNHLNNKGGYCCLGVACKILIPKEKLEFDGKRIDGAMPAEQKYAPKWLKDINSDFDIRTGRSIAELNDYGAYVGDNRTKPFTFNEIADLIELVYIHKIKL